jgi:hypothetical protein
MNVDLSRRPTALRARRAAAATTLAAALGAATLAGAPAQAQILPGQAAQANPCGPIYIRGHHGPFDYRTQRANLQIVEDFHFTPEIEAGLRGRNGPIGGDINYTLKSSPNHHRALITLMQVSRRLKSEQIRGLEWPLECFFDRAIRFQKDDVIVRMLYAQYLSERTRREDALKQLEIAMDLAGDNPFTHYNIGMLFADAADWDRALKQAHKAMSLGFPRTELGDRLRQAGRWSEPAPAPAPTSATAASAPTATAASAPAAAASRP